MHTDNGQKNGAGLYGEILELQKYVNKFRPPKQLVLTEWLARPAQPVAAAYPVLRDNGVAAYNWALIIVDCTSHWNRPIVPGDPPFQEPHTHAHTYSRNCTHPDPHISRSHHPHMHALTHPHMHALPHPQGMIWPNGSAFDDVEEGECMRTKCTTVKYVHHCCNNWHANGSALNHLWTFSADATSNLSHWQTKVFGSPTYRLPGPREGSMRWTNQSGASFTLGPLPPGTQRVALYLPKSPEGAQYTITLDGRPAGTGSTLSQQKQWLFRKIVSVTGGHTLKLTIGKATNATKFSVSGATFFSS